MDIFGFILAALALLATPGPTNTLLFTSGAVAGFRSFRLLAGELAGYQLSISVLIILLGPVLATHPGLKLVLQGACAGYLVYAASSLWRRGELSADAAIGPHRVFVTTFLNPKAFIFASTVIPGDPLASFSARLPWLGGLSVLIVAVGACWICAGAVTRKGSGRWLSAGLCCRGGAVALMAFAALLCWSVVASALSLYGGLGR